MALYLSTCAHNGMNPGELVEIDDDDHPDYQGMIELGFLVKQVPASFFVGDRAEEAERIRAKAAAESLVGMPEPAIVNEP